MRMPAGELDALEVDDAALGAVADALRSFAEQHPGLLVEAKPASVALHYRARPELADLSLDAARQAMPTGAPLHMLQGKMVIEIKAHAGDKGTAIASFMKLAQFSGRVPVFIGDDVTDEAAFTEVNRRKGVSIKVGCGATAAQFRIADPAAVQRLLIGLCKRFEQEEVTGELAT